MKHTLAHLTALLLAPLAMLHAAELKLPSVFSDHAVLQRGMPVPVWGTADAGDEITVEFAGQKKMAKADASGKWNVKLDAMPASAQPRELKVTDSKTPSAAILLKDVLVGEVWFASGQSNMEMMVGNFSERYPGVDNYQAEIKNANYPNLRLLKIEPGNPRQPQSKAITKGWNPCTPESAKPFSAVAYFFGRHLRENMDVPIGIIASAKSSSRVEQWTSLEGLTGLPQFADVVEFFSDPATYDLSHHEFRACVPDRQPTGLFNGGLAPLIPYAIRGAIWYQGEGNSSRAVEYQTLLPNMIADWRGRWGLGDFPFIVVQLAGWGKEGSSTVGDDAWAELREAQTLTALATPQVYLATAIDIGGKAIHPTNKQDVGKRCGLVARAKVYGEDIPFSGPVFQKMVINGAAAILSFDHLAGGLVSKNEERPGTLSDFAIAGSDRTWHRAEATIKGDQVRVSSPDVRKPEAVRYGWSRQVEADFYNQVGLPAMPFRTDDWPLSTEGNVYSPARESK